MSARRQVRWPTLVLALLCLVAVVTGAYLALAGDGGTRALGVGLVGFFGAGVVVLGRQAFQ